MLALPSPLSLPETLTGSLRLTPEPFAEFCTANPNAVLELASMGPADRLDGALLFPGLVTDLEEIWAG